MKTREALDAQLETATNNREIVETMAALATDAWRTGKEEAHQRLEFWFAYYHIATRKNSADKSIVVTQFMLAGLEKASWRVQRHWDEPITARRCAKAMIHLYVVRGDTVKDLSYGGMGSANHWFDASIGGYFYPGNEPDAKPIKLGPWRIGVSRVLDQRCAEIFELRELYDEIQREARGSEVITQASLF